ncbi:hypothetical protein AAU61_00595 [Desulfocarbo indianensis]|nr:hypothetical protein AAU61_00595 [Desulfocarbo indianensis]
MRVGDDREVPYAIARHVMERVSRDKRIVRSTLFSSLEGLHMAEHEGTPIQILEGYFAKRMQEGALRAKDPHLAARFFLFAVSFYVTDIYIKFFGEPLVVSDKEAAWTLADMFMDRLLPLE